MKKTLSKSGNYNFSTANSSLSRSGISAKDGKSHYHFTPKQVFISQIVNVVKLRLVIENIKGSDEELIAIIKENVNGIDIRDMSISVVNTGVDDLIEIIKENKEKEKEDNTTSSNLSTTNKSGNRSTILNYNPKEYEKLSKTCTLGSLIRKNKTVTKKKKNNKAAMKFSLSHNYGKDTINDVEFYLDSNKNNEISLGNDCDIENIEEKIINEVSKGK